MAIDTVPFVLKRQTQRTLLLSTCTLAAIFWMTGGYARWFVWCAVLFIVPGWWLARWTAAQVPWYVRLAVGCVVVATISAWGAALEIAIPTGVWAGSAAIGTVLMVRRLWRHAADRVLSLPTLLPAVVCIAATAVVVWSRFAAIEQLALPPWVDSVHHAVLLRVAVERGHAPWDLTPLVPVTALTYHSGFHSIMAVLLALSDIPLTDVGTYLLIGGQLWNMLAVATLAGLAWSWSRSWWAVATLLIVVGVVSFMPAYYLSWGRYTLLCGMALFPAALWVLDNSWREQRRGLHPLWIVCTVGALALVHMVVCVMAVLWGVVLLVRRGMPARSVWIGAIAMLCATAPWWWLLLSHTQAGAGASAMHIQGNASHNSLSVGLIWAQANVWLVPAALVAAWYGIHRRMVQTASVVLWLAAVGLMANPPVIGLPYLSFFTNDTVTTALFVPIGLVLAWTAPLLRRRVPRWVLAAVLAVLLTTTAAGSAQVVTPATIIATADDRAALEWASTNLPADATVLTNATGWMWGVERGADGGWWLLPIAGIQTTTPPVLYTYADPATVAALRATTATVATGDGSLRFVEELVAEHGEVTYIYASERGVIKPSVLDTSDQFEARFRRGDVAIYAVIW